MPVAATASTVGRMKSISSVPKRPPSPPCGLSAQTAMRGFAMPTRRIIRSASWIASVIDCGLIRSSAFLSETCEVTRLIHCPSTTFISEK